MDGNSDAVPMKCSQRLCVGNDQLLVFLAGAVREAVVTMSVPQRGSVWVDLIVDN